MATIRKRKGKRGIRWAVQIELKKQTAYKTFRTQAEAFAWANDIEERIRRGDPTGTTARGKTVEDLLMKYLEEDMPAAAPVDRNRILRICRDPLARVLLSQLGPKDIDDWQKRRLLKVQGASIRRDRNALNPIFKKAVRVWKWLAMNPLPDVAPPKDNPPRERVCSINELERLWYVATDDLYLVQARVMAAFEVCCEIGCRGAELLALTRANVNLAASTVFFPKTKNGDRRHAALTPRAKALIAQIMELKLEPVFGLTLTQKDNTFRMLCDKTGIDGLTFHDSRGTACTKLAKKMDVLDLAKQLGTRDIKTLMTYYRATAEDRAKLLAA